MPNWCSNVITLSGTGLEEFRKTLNTVNDAGELAVFSFKQIVYRPKEEDENWYEWNIKNWGTKWDVSDGDFQDKGDSIVINCDTAWSPPFAWAKQASISIPDLIIVINYRESGVGFCGTFATLNGNSKNVEEEFINSIDSEEEIETPEFAC